ncbi:MAG: hypothetical protein LBG62_07105 [Candidatus Methanoplasma sp.]|nr:hypothetical protein [Candidatus Methanoplasma sp.]
MTEGRGEPEVIDLRAKIRDAEWTLCRIVNSIMEADRKSSVILASSGVALAILLSGGFGRLRDIADGALTVALVVAVAIMAAGMIALFFVLFPRTDPVRNSGGGGRAREPRHRLLAVF